MKTLAVSNRIVQVVLLIALTQFACSLSAQPTGAAPQPPPAAQSERGTPAEAQAMLQKAIEHYNPVGRDQALADFNGRVAPFFDRDLYVVCIDPYHTETANGGFPAYVGSSADLLTDANGNPLGKTVWDTSSSTVVNSVNYHWTNPSPDKPGRKHSSSQRSARTSAGLARTIHRQ